MQNESYKYLYESVKDKFDFVRDADNAFDTKIGVLIAAVIGLLTVYFAIVNIGELESNKLRQAVAAVVLIFSSLLILIWIQFPKKYRTIIGDQELINAYINKSEIDLLLQLISDAQFAFVENKRILDRKVKYYKYAIFILFVSFPLLLSALPVIKY